MKLEEHNMLITGGGAGVGLALVEHFRALAKRIAVLEKNEDSCRSLEETYPGMVAIQCDVSDPDSVGSAFRQLDDQGFQVSVLVNNAGAIHSEPLVNMLKKNDRGHSTVHWRSTLATNLDSVFYVTRETVDRMLARRQKGVVVSISSISAQGNAGQSAYSAAKAGVDALTRTWAKEVGPLGIRFGAVAPGFLDTPSTRHAMGEKRLEKIRMETPLGRLGSVVHVTQSVEYLIRNDFVNGAILPVNGGLTLS